jgi:hypothetical protein
MLQRQVDHREGQHPDRRVEEPLARGRRRPAIEPGQHQAERDDEGTQHEAEMQDGQAEDDREPLHPTFPAISP